MNDTKTEKAPRRKLSVKEYGALLMNRVHKELDNGLQPDKAIEKALTPAQYDWLIDHDYDLDSILLSKEQREAVKETVKKAHTRRLSPEGYKKKYPEDKQMLYNAINDCLKELGAETTIPEKCNFRDLEFTYNGKKYKIVLSMPRK